jgi:chromosome segregation protein
VIQFTKMRLSGFKSFVDPTELLIEPGMTGVVGPNGCGKSNLVEALRWVMGETSAKQMRGGEMDDVIFGGTSHRPARNMAEITVVLDNSALMAPALFKDAPEIEITRRIDRGQGSDYRFNGKPIRAKDVQLLFADAATGARSTAMVSQGRVGALIAAKPAQRRSLLEEAAGIGGLYSRRHEAELRLKAAEANLERLSDVVAALETQLGSLRRQARQAQRYRALSESIRSTEAQLLYRRWDGAMQAQTVARQALREAEHAVASISGGTSEATREQIEASEAVPALREADAEAGARLQRLTIAREQLDAEEQRLTSQRVQAEQRLRQIQEDMEREQTRTTDAAEALEALSEEHELLASEQEGEEDMEVAARERVETLSAQVEDEDHQLHTLSDRLTNEEAALRAAERRIQDAQTRLDRLSQRLTEAQRALEAETQAEATDGSLEMAREAVEEAAEALEESRFAAEDADADAEQARSLQDQAREALQEVAGERSRLRAEHDALQAVLADPAGEGDWTPVVDAMTVAEGMENALAVALGDDLSAPEDGAAPVHWSSLPPFDQPPALPEGATPLAVHVQAPAALGRRLSQVGLVADHAQGAALWTALLPGQRLVTLDGDLWRWDGLAVRAGAPSAAAVRLRQRNRRDQVAQLLEGVESRFAQAQNQADHARTQAEQAAQMARQTRDRVRAAEGALSQAQAALAAEDRRAQAAQARLAAARAQVDQVQADHADAAQDLATARQARQESADSQATRAAMERLRASVNERRRWLAEAQSTLDRVLRDAGERRQRLQRVSGEIQSWQQRLQGADSQRQQLNERHQAVSEELETLAERPQEIAESRLVLLDALEEAEGERRQTADALAAGERRLAEAERALRESEKALGGLREQKIRAEAALEQADAEVRQTASAIAERLDCTPVQARRLAGLDPDAPPVGADEDGQSALALPAVPVSLSDLETRLGRLTRDREAMGPVNLRAEQEAAELEGQMATLIHERDDLVAAIDRLRQGINELNREGRQRLVASFEKVDAHFRRLFTRLFGGGRAHLALTESDDPLQAGLEIYASPPGKRLQILSLLSGGEQAMTAVALLFAVFLVNPAPICVLDEVDAPLDDANVDRFCSLLSELTRLAAADGEGKGGTRFLVITHHRMTMARMDRLYGVTMAERGVSKLVSVDLRQAEALRDGP